MKDKLLAGKHAARMMDMSLGEDNKAVVKVRMEGRMELDQWLLERFTVSVAGKDLDLDALDPADGGKLLDELWSANGDRLGIDPESGFATKEDAGKALPKGSAKK